MQELTFTKCTSSWLVATKTMHETEAEGTAMFCCGVQTATGRPEFWLEADGCIHTIFPQADGTSKQGWIEKESIFGRAYRDGGRFKSCTQLTAEQFYGQAEEGGRLGVAQMCTDVKNMAEIEGGTLERPSQLCYEMCRTAAGVSSSCTDMRRLGFSFDLQPYEPPPRAPATALTEELSNIADDAERQRFFSCNAAGVEREAFDSLLYNKQLCKWWNSLQAAQKLDFEENSPSMIKSIEEAMIFQNTISGKHPEAGLLPRHKK